MRKILRLAEESILDVYGARTDYQFDPLARRCKNGHRAGRDKHHHCLACRKEQNRKDAATYRRRTSERRGTVAA